MSIAEERNIAEERKQKKWEQDMKKKTLRENVKMLKGKGYSDMAVSKFLKIPLTTVRAYMDT